VDLVVFWIVAPISVLAGVLMLMQRSAVYSALFLILTQFTLAVFFVLLGAHFLAAVQVIVYAGAIMVLFLFVIMFLGVDRREALVEPIRGQRPLAVGLGVILIAEVVVAVRLGVGLLRTGALPPSRGTVEDVARSLFTDYVFPFEVTSVLLIVAAIAAMVMARRRGRGLPPEAEGEEVEAEPAERPPAPEPTPAPEAAR
jgi:NADH-quinone oxidoreductase subunit J